MENKVEYCIECGVKNPQNNRVCECNSESFVFGESFEYKDGNILCTCGSDLFKMVSRINKHPHYHEVYKCIKCDNIVNRQTYYKFDKIGLLKPKIEEIEESI